MISKAIAGIVGLALLITGFVIVPLSVGESGDDRYSAYGDHFTSLSDARSALAANEYDVANLGSSPMILRDVDPEATVLFVVGMERAYASYEMEAMDDFLERGGHIVLLDDGAYGNQYTTRHGIEFLRARVLDEQFSNNKSFVWAQAQLEREKPYDVLLAGPVALEDVDPNSTTLRPFIVNRGFLDLNNDGRIDAIDKGGLSTSGTTQTINIGIQKDFAAGGRLTVMSDSGWIVDDMLQRDVDPDDGRTSNQDFLLALVAEALPDGDGLVLFDESRRGTVGLESSIYGAEKGLMGLFRSIPVVGVMFTLAMMTALVLLLLQIPGRQDWRHRHRPGALVAPQDGGHRHLLREVLERQVRISGGIEQIRDDVIRQAAADPDSLRDEDARLVIERIVDTLGLDVKAIQADETPT